MIHIQAIGTIDVRVGGTPVRQGSALLFALVLFLGLTAGRRVARSQLVELFWPDAEESDGRHALRQLLYRLRKEGLQLSLDGAELLVERNAVQCDLYAVLDSQWPEYADDATVRAAAIVLPGYAPPLADSFRDWLDQLRAQVAAQFRRAVLRRIVAARRDGRWAEVDHWAQQCLAVDPLNEEAVLAKAEATALAGGKAEALRILDGYMAELGDRSRQIGLPANILRRRVSEQLSDVPHGSAFDRLLVGRDEEMKALLNLLAEARARRGGCAEICGPAGIGKSRLATELRREAELRGFVSCDVRLQSTDKSRPFAVLLDAVPILSKLPGALGCAPESVSTLRRLVEHDQRSVTPADDATDIEVRLHHIRVAVLDLLGAVSEENPLLLLVDDAQHMDAASRALLDDLVRWSGTQRVLWLMTRRVVESGASVKGADAATNVIELGPLSEDSCRKLIAVAMTSINDADRDQLLTACRSVGGGNPFFIREILANWDVNRKFDSLPDSVAQAVSRRVARLGGPALRTLQCSALLGGLATVGRASRVLQVPMTESLDAIAELERAGISNLQDGESGLLLHDLWRDEVTRIIRPATAQLLHSRIADVLEDEGQPKRLAALLWEAARHRALAGEPGRAVSLLEDCADHLLAIGLPDDAAETMSRADVLCRTDEERLRCLNRRMRALDASGKWDGFDLQIPRVRELSYRVNPVYDQHDEFELIETELLWRREIDPRECQRRAIVCSSLPSASLEHRLRALKIRVIVDDNLCDDQDMETAHSLARQLTVERAVRSVHGLTVEGIYHTVLGNPTIAVNRWRDVIAHDRQTGSLKAQCRSLRSIGYPLRILGAFDECRELLRQSLDLAEKYRFAADATSACDVLATIAMEHFQLDEASQWVERAAYWSAQVDANLDRNVPKLLRAELALAKGDAQNVLQILGEDLNAINLDPIPRSVLSIIGMLTNAYILLERRDDVVRTIPLLENRQRMTIRKGRQDGYIRTIGRALVFVGRSDDARSLVRQYISAQRRDHSPVPKDLINMAMVD